MTFRIQQRGPLIRWLSPTALVLPFVLLWAISIAPVAAAEPIRGPWDFPLEKFGGTHTRTAGARGATIRLGRENNISMMQLMSILSYNAAKHMGDTGLKAMQERGRIQPGMVADIVVFDPERFTDNSTYDKGSAPSTGMKAVVANGKITVRDDKVLPVFAGQPIQFEPEAKPRFVPISEESWNAAFSTGMPDTFTGAVPENTGHRSLRTQTRRRENVRLRRRPTGRVGRI